MNFLKGYKWSLSISAAFRHIYKFLLGESLDRESGLTIVFRLPDLAYILTFENQAARDVTRPW